MNDEGLPKMVVLGTTKDGKIGVTPMPVSIEFLEALLTEIGKFTKATGDSKSFRSVTINIMEAEAYLAKLCADALRDLEEE